MGTRYRIRSLTSKDGIHWQFHDDWVIDDAADTEPDGIGAAGAFDDIQRSYPAVIKQGDIYHFWYTGNWFGQAGSGYKTGLGYARGKIHSLKP
jgi:hypothetical protein